MRSLAWLAAIIFSLTACTHTYYVVRHAEKAGLETAMSSSAAKGDVPLSDAGRRRALALRDSLADKAIAVIYSTNTLRTLSTAAPTAERFHVKPRIYDPRPDSGFIRELKSLRRNALIVGHSNTIDDIVNGLTGSMSVGSDLGDDEYDNLFVIKYKGRRVVFERKKFGEPSAGK